MPLPQLYHFSAERLSRPMLADRPQVRAHMASLAWKPTGLWVTPARGRNWPDWCRAERFRDQDLAFRTKVILKPSANILWLKSESDLRRFDLRWGSSSVLRGYEGARFKGINWLALARAYDGILIAPYIWQCRLDTFWYYGWDCASGCIWNVKRAIAALECKPYHPGYKSRKPLSPEELRALSATLSESVDKMRATRAKTEEADAKEA